MEIIQNINKYEIIEKIGMGTFSNVFKARNINDGKNYAIKMFYKYNGFTELKILQKVKHFCLLQYLEGFFQDEKFYLITEFCEGGSIRDIIQENNENKTQIEEQNCLDWSKAIILGLEYLHENLIIHRDIKPENILLNHGEIKIADFGISRIMEYSDTITLTQNIGTYIYMSPEIREIKPYSFKTDIWSAGCVIFEMIFMQKFVDFIQNIKNENFEKPILTKLAQLLKKMLIRDQHKRFSASELSNLFLKNSDNNQSDLEILTYNDLKFLINGSLLPPSFLPPRLSDFVLREEEIRLINKAFANEDKIIVVVSSITGVGKTSLAIEFAHRFKEQTNNLVYWMKSDGNSLDDEFQSFALDINLASFGIRIDRTILIRRLQNIINLHQNQKILFIFDKCDDYQMIAHYISAFSSLKNVFIIVTTRDVHLVEDIHFKKAIILLNPLNIEECFEYLKAKLTTKIAAYGQVNEKDLENLIHLCLTNNEPIRPIFLEKLIAIIQFNKRYKTLKQIIKDINDRIIKIDLFKENELFELIQKNDKNNWEIMKVSSFLNGDFIPIDFYTKILLDFEIETLQNSIAQLEKDSLLQINESDEKIGIKMPKFLQSEIQEYLKFIHPDELNKIKTQFEIKFTEFLKNERKIQRENGWNKSVYYNNFIKILEMLTLNNDLLQNENLAELYQSFGEYIYDFELDYEKSLEYFNKSLIIFQNLNSNVNENINLARTLNYIGMTYSALGDNSKAVELFRSYLPLTTNSEVLAKFLNTEGVCYYRLGKPEAINSLKKSESIIEKLQNTNELFTSDVLNNIGIFYSLFGNSVEAFKNLIKSQQIKREKYGDDFNLEIAVNLDYIGITYADLGHFEEALENFLKALAIKQKIYENQNSSQIVFTLNNISNTYAKLNKNKDAQDFCQRSLSILKNMKMDYYSIVGNIQVDFNQGLISLNSKDFSNACEYFKKSLVAFETFFKTTNNIYIAECFSYIGLSKFHMKQMNEAKEFFDKSFNIFNASLISGTNSRMAQVYSNLAMYYGKLNNIQEESNYNEKVSCIKNRILMEIHNSIQKFGLQKGTIVGKYTIIQPIGTGAFGDVYKVKHNETKNIFALKVLKPTGDYDINREFKILNKLKNINFKYLIKLKDKVFNPEGYHHIYCIITEFCDKGTLDDLIRKKEKIDLDIVFEWTGQIVKALSFLHNECIIHRDIDPRNIFLSIDNDIEHKPTIIKIGDFGFSKIKDGSTCSIYCGKYGYKAPEVSANENYDFNADIWSTGCVLFELIFLEKYQDKKTNDRQFSARIQQRLIKLLRLMLIRNKVNRPSSKNIEDIFDLLADETDIGTLNINDLENDFKLPLEISLPKSFIPSQIKNFIGEPIIKQIEDSFFKNSKKVVNLTSDLKSVGKSATANEYAHRFEKKHETIGVYWMKSNENNLDLELSLFAFNFIGEELQFNSNRKEMIKVIKSKLKKLEKKGKILFVFDDCNLVNNHIYINELSSLNNTFVLVTSDKFVDESNYQTIIAEPFETDKSISFLQHTLESLNDSKCRQFLEIFGLLNEKILPNVLLKLIVLINLKIGLSSDFETALNELKIIDNKKHYLDNYLEELERKRNKSWQLLKLSSILDTDFIPYKIFTNIFLINEEDIEASISFLLKSSMVFKEKKENEEGIRLHTYLKEDIKGYLKNQPFELTNQQFENLDDFISASHQNNKSIHIFNFKFLLENIMENPSFAFDKKQNLRKKFKNYLERFNILLIENPVNYEATLQKCEANSKKRNNEETVDMNSILKEPEKGT